FFQAEDGIRDFHVTGVQTCALPISTRRVSRYSRTVSSDTTSAYLAAISTRLAAWGSAALSPTHSRGTSAGNPYWSRSMAVARTHPLVVAPHRITVSTPSAVRIADRFVPKNADAPFFTMTVSPGRRPRRGSTSTQGDPTWSSSTDGIFCGQMPASAVPSKAIVVKRTGTSDSRAASRRRRVAVTSEVRSEPSRHLG